MWSGVTCKKADRLLSLRSFCVVKERVSFHVGTLQRRHSSSCRGDQDLSFARIEHLPNETWKRSRGSLQNSEHSCKKSFLEHILKQLILHVSQGVRWTNLAAASSAASKVTGQWKVQRIPNEVGDRVCHNNNNLAHLLGSLGLVTKSRQDNRASTNRPLTSQAIKLASPRCKAAALDGHKNVWFMEDEDGDVMSRSCPSASHYRNGLGVVAASPEPKAE